MRKLKFGITLMCFLSINLSFTYSQTASAGQILKKGSSNPYDCSNLFEYTSGATIKRLIFPFNSASFNSTDYCFEIKVPSLNSDYGFKISNPLGTSITLINPDGFALFQTGGLSGKNYLQSKTAIGGTGMFNPVTTLHVNGSGLFTKNLAIGQSSEASAQLEITSSDTVKIKFSPSDSQPVAFINSGRTSDFQYWVITRDDTSPIEGADGGGEINPGTVPYSRKLAFSIKPNGEILSSFATISNRVTASNVESNTIKANSLMANNATVLNRITASVVESNTTKADSLIASYATILKHIKAINVESGIIKTDSLISNSIKLLPNAGQDKLLVCNGNEGDGRWVESSEVIPQYWINNGSGAVYTDKLSVGIKTGLTGPYDLAVNGIIGCKELKVEINSAIWAWPDYVFAPDYNLPSLDKVELYVKENRHLPDVPSSETISKEGISIGEMQAVLLKKVEELTLYIIEQNKHIKEQELQIENLKSLLIK